MPDLPPDPVAAPRSPRARLHSARDRLVRECAEADSVLAPEPELLAEEIHRVCARVETHLVGGSLPAVEAANADRAGIVDALRARILADWGDDEPAEALRTLRALEAVRADVVEGGGGPLAPGVLSPWGHRLLREVAHTLRSPLGSVVMLAQTLREGVSGEVNDAQRKHLGIIHRAAMSVANMANDLLGLTREESGADMAPVSAAEIVDEVADAVEPVAEERALAFTVRIDEAATPIADALALERVLMDLVLNAALLARNGTLEVTVESGAEGSVVFEVAASEVPPTEGMLDVFPLPDPQGDYTLSRSGLGFATARHLLRRMGSRLEVEHAPEGRLVLRFALRSAPHP